MDKQHIEGWLQKNEKTNQVQIFKQERKDALPICTEYMPLKQLTYNGNPYTYLEINLITGRSHQIRSAPASTGHPLIGDTKYRQSEYKLRNSEKLRSEIPASPCLSAGASGAHRSSFESFGAAVYCAAFQRIYERFEPWLM